MTLVALLSAGAVLLGLAHLTARIVCASRGHAWQRELTDEEEIRTAFRCRRCRQWARTGDS